MLRVMMVFLGYLGMDLLKVDIWSTSMMRMLLYVCRVILLNVMGKGAESATFVVGDGLVLIPSRPGFAASPVYYPFMQVRFFAQSEMFFFDAANFRSSSVNNLVGIKPIVNLTSRSLVIPISSHQDTVGLRRVICLFNLNMYHLGYLNSANGKCKIQWLLYKELRCRCARTACNSSMCRYPIFRPAKDENAD
jgi:hypothetical protein